ncbi:MAG: outer membrane protein transport protein [Verrucomicrobia bacterium]|nr:outer membrane protein transport protein [Verrucomicrobiota bacterium]
MKPIRSVTVAVAGCSYLIASSSAFALGFRNPDQGARATAQGEAFVAQADDATAVYYNPAGMTQLEGYHSAAGAYALFPSSHFSGAAGKTEMNVESYSPHFYNVADFGLRDWRFGLGINAPYGNAVNYSHYGPFRYTVTESYLKILNVAPTVAYRINDQWSVGAGLNIYRGSTELKRMVSWAPFPVPDSRFKFKGVGYALGGTAGVLFKLNEQHTFGMNYRSPFQIDMEGDARLYSPPPIPSDYGPSKTKARMQFPQSASLGYAFRPIKDLKIEFDLEWTNWDMVNDVRLRSSNPNFDALVAPAANTLSFDWMDSFFYELGLQYDISNHWALRAGYIFSENSVPNRTFGPAVPDADRHVFSIGGGCSFRHINVDVVYQYSLVEDRTVSTSAVTAANGKWESSGHAIMLTGTIKF